MTNAIAPTPNTALVSVADRLKAELARNREAFRSGSKYISVENGRFILPNGKADTALTAIILDLRRVNLYYKHAFNPKVKAKPECFAVGLDEYTDMRPHLAAPNPQTGECCGACPHNQWKSGPTGTGKRCKNTVRLALLPPNSTDPEHILLLNVPPTSLKNNQNYLASLSVDELHPAQVLTRFSLDPTATYTKLIMERAGLTTNLEALNAALLASTKLLESTFGLIAD